MFTNGRLGLFMTLWLSLSIGYILSPVCDCFWNNTYMTMKNADIFKSHAYLLHRKRCPLTVKLKRVWECDVDLGANEENKNFVLDGLDCFWTSSSDQWSLMPRDGALKIPAAKRLIYQFYKTNKAGVWCNIGYSSEIHLEHTSCEISFVDGILLNNLIVHRVWQHHCRVLYNIAKRLDNCNKYYGRTRFHEILYYDEFRPNIPYCTAPLVCTRYQLWNTNPVT